MKTTQLWMYIEEHMLAAGLSQTRLAVEGGMANSSMSYVRNNHTVPGDELLWRICGVLPDIDFDELMRLRDLTAATRIKAGLRLNTNFSGRVRSDNIAAPRPRHRGNYKKPQDEIQLTNNGHRQARRCLKCNKKFKSEGPWNHICSPCNTINANYTQPAARIYKIMEPGKLAV